MKTLVTILFAIITVVSYSQKSLAKYTLYSDFWRNDIVLENGEKVVHILPINSNYFSLNTTYVKQNINESEIEKYLLEAFNKFRKEYNSVPVTEDVSITKAAKAYSKKLMESHTLVHDVNLPYEQCECITKLPTMMLSHITKEDGDINKIIADCYFDIFASSNSHMDILLDKRVTKFGFGITVDEGISIVIRGKR